MNELLERVPVIVGVGQVTNRDDNDRREPLDLLAEAAGLAADDSGAGSKLLDLVDAVDVVNVLSWPYADLPRQLAERFGVVPAHAAHSPVGGDQPTRLVAAAAARIAAGQSRAALIAGGEAIRSLELAMKEGGPPPWTPAPAGAGWPVNPRSFVSDLAAEHGLIMPIAVYPLYENATRAAWGQPYADAQTESAVIWSEMSAVAARNPGAWNGQMRSPGQILSPGPSNRKVAHPYTKLQCAHLSVNQAAAVLMTDAETARRLGIPEDRWVHPWGAAGAHDTPDFLARATYFWAPGMEATLSDTLANSAIDINDVDLFELYSCFPCVTKMATNFLGLPMSERVTVTGGLTFFGGPGNAYMLCATVAMVEALRRGDGQVGLMYGQGEFVTKHHGLVLAVWPWPGDVYPVDDESERQQLIDSLIPPEIDPEPDGPAEIETCTVVYDREGAPERGIVIGRLEDGRRFAANTAPGDDATIAALTSHKDEAIGRFGRVTPGHPNRFTLG